MALKRMPGGFTIYQLLTRVIPGLLVICVIISILSIEQAVDFLSEEDGRAILNIFLDWLEIIVAYYLWVPILVGAIIIGEFIDIARKSLFPVPKKFRKFVYYRSDRDKSVLTLSQYVVVDLEERYKNPNQTNRVQTYVRHPYIWSLGLGIYLSLWTAGVTDNYVRGFQLFLVSQIIALPLIIFREEIMSSTALVNNVFFKYWRDSPNSYFDLNSSDDILQKLRTDCNFDEDLNDPIELYFGLNMLVDEPSNTNTTDLQMMYQFNKNILISLYISLVFLIIAVIFGTVIQQIFVLLFIYVIFPIAIIYYFISSLLGIEHEFIDSLLIEYHISRNQTG